MSKIDKLIRTSLEDTPKADPAVNSRLAAKYDRFLKKSQKATAHEKNYELSIRELEHYKRPVSMRIGSAAAVLAIVAALGGSVAAFCNFRIDTPDDTLTDMTEAVTEQTNASDSSKTGVIEYDMSTKEGIFGKMINSIDFYDNVSGNLTIAYTDNQYTVVDFQCEVLTGCSFSHSAVYETQNICDEPDTSSKLPEENDNYEFCDGIYNYDIKGSRYSINNDEPFQGGRDNSPIDSEALRAFLLYTGEDAPENTRILRDGANSSMAADCITPANAACKLLADFESWDITGEIDYIGRNCISIAGVYETYSFDMYVDKDTGCLLYCKTCDGDYIDDYLEVTQISFDREAEPVKMIDLTQYISMSGDSDLAVKWEGDSLQDFTLDYKTNSSGQTYGSCGDIEISPENDELLPDFILFKGGYVLKEDIFKTFGSEEQMNKYHREHNKIDGETAVISLNLYDCDGNSINSVLNFYGEP